MVRVFFFFFDVVGKWTILCLVGGGTPPPIPSAGKTLICLGQMTFTNFYNFLDTDSNDFLDILYNEEGP